MFLPEVYQTNYLNRFIYLLINIEISCKLSCLGLAQFCDLTWIELEKEEKNDYF